MDRELVRLAKLFGFIGTTLMAILWVDAISDPIARTWGLVGKLQRAGMWLVPLGVTVAPHQPKSHLARNNRPTRNADGQASDERDQNGR